MMRASTALLLNSQRRKTEEKKMIVAIIAGAGLGNRMCSRTPKIFMKLQGKPIGYYAARTLADIEEIQQIVFTVPPGWINRARKISSGWEIPLSIIEGADTRQNTVFKALQTLPQNTKMVVVHDGARPLGSAKIVRAVIEGAREHGACVPTLPSEETIKLVRGERVVETLNRDQIHSVQTPQAFYFDVIFEAHKHAFERRWRATDDATLVERIGRPVATVPGERTNIKITHPLDLKIAGLMMKIKQT
jgi:2-C-methyl-D-erythritol 4-phosphate cytidylyltransferase